jgi:hypothetical protein
MIRKAKLSDVKEIYALVEEFAKKVMRRARLAWMRSSPLPTLPSFLVSLGLRALKKRSSRTRSGVSA